MHLRPLDLKDTQLIFDWRNDPIIISLSSSQKNVTWEEHKNWIKNSIDNLHRKVYIIYIGEFAIGQVRFDRITNTKCAAITVYLLNIHTGNGYGVDAIKLGTDSIFLIWKDLMEIYAFVREDNIPSQKAFIKSGFKNTYHANPLPPKHLIFSIKNHAQ